VALFVVLARGGAGWTETAGPIADLPSDTGLIRLFSASGPITLPHPFAQDFGTNGRMCVVCHDPTEGMSITPAGVRARFDDSSGFDPIFRTNDGSNSPTANVSTLAARRAAYSLLLSRGVIRIEMGVPPGAEFFVESVDDPYGYAAPTRLSLFRRPPPTANLAFLTSVMWDGRETTGLGARSDLARQASDATVGHAQAVQALTAAQQAPIVDLEETLFAAQVFDGNAGSLSADGAAGGPEALSGQPFFPGINSGTAASLLVFNVFDAWTNLPPTPDPLTQARRIIASGQTIFNTRDLAAGVRCSSCHNTPNVGNESGGNFFNTGVADGARRIPDVPLYTLSCPLTQTVIRTTDPGRALVTGRCGDINAFKVPSLRGLAARPPFFHDGSAATLRDVVLFYDDLFKAGLQPFEVDALVAFLRAL
jgi:cytochrome c peroxidase